MKAYKDANGKVRLFRPMENMKRFNRSCSRLVLPVRSSPAWRAC
jgi:branched-chain amino acid aminotransferase